MKSDFDERPYVERVLKGDREAFQALVEAYQQRIFNFVSHVLGSREDAEDIVQESFVKAYLSLNTFRGQSSFYTWVYRIAFNMAVDHRRRMARRGGGPVELEELHRSVTPLVPFSSHGPSEALERRETGSIIERELMKLSEDHRVAIALREIDGLSYDEIAKVTNVSKGTVMSRLHYARKKLQEALKEIAPEGSRPDGGQEEGLTGALKRAKVG